MAVARAEFVKFPYLQNLTDSTVVVRWETATPVSGKVQYGLSRAYGMEVGHTNPAIDHELVLTGLVRDTVYHYRVISGADTSVDGVFHTPVSPAARFRFVVLGDNRSDSAAHQSVVDRILLVNPGPGLVINVGDLTDAGDTGEFRTFFNVEERLLGAVAMYPALGNHDIRNLSNWFRFFTLPNNERWYTVRYGNAVFHCLDNYSEYTPGSEQFNWLVSELIADSADPLVRHIFVFFHEPPYTTNQAHSGNLTIREHLCPLFERFGVTLTFQGHVHAYEHGVVNGVHYIISGGGGAPLHNQWRPAQPWTVYREATFEFVLVDVFGDTVFCRGIKPDGVVIDSFQVLSRRSGVEETTGSLARVNTFSVYPNPCQANLRISGGITASGQNQLWLCDAAGQKVMTLKADKNDISRLAAGVYFVKDDTRTIQRVVITR